MGTVSFSPYFKKRGIVPFLHKKGSTSGNGPLTSDFIDGLHT